ncbi:MAG: biopolymer transporter ExbD [Waddliaceae bacterium]
MLRQHHQRDAELHVNVTPLIDVVFSILIMFIVLAPLLELDRVELAEGKGEKADSCVSVSENGPITLHVQKDDTVLLNQRIVELACLADLLKKEKQQHPHARPQVFHDKSASFGTYQMIKNAVESAGFTQMDVILYPNNLTVMSHAAG